MCGRREGWSIFGADAIEVDGRATAHACAAAGLKDRLDGAPLHLILCATGALQIGGHAPEKALARVQPAAMVAQFALNAIGPAMVFKHMAPLLPRRDRGLIGVLSARVGSIGDNRLGGWLSYRAAKAAANQVIRTSAIELGRTRPGAVALALHPGTVATDLTRAHRREYDAVFHHRCDRPTHQG